MPPQESWETFFYADCVLGALDCGPNCGDVVEFGCGYGTFTEVAARRVAGTVHALDIDPAMVEVTQLRVDRAGLKNVRVETRDFVAAGTGLPDGSAGYAMLFNILHIENPVALLQEAFRVLRPGGTAAIIHWNYDSKTPRGPSMEIRPRPEQCRVWANLAGFQIIREEPLTCCAHHYGLVARRLGGA